MLSPYSMISLFHKKKKREKKKEVMSLFIGSICNNFGPSLVRIHSICIWKLS